MPRQLTEDQKQLCRELMTSFGETEETVTMETLLTMLRAVGGNPVTREVHEALQHQGIEAHATMTYVETQAFIENYLPDADMASPDVQEAIQKLDKTGSGTMSVTCLRRVVTAAGSEPLTPAEADELARMLEEAGVLCDGQVSVRETSRKVMGSSEGNHQKVIRKLQKLQERDTL